MRLITKEKEVEKQKCDLFKIPSIPIILYAQNSFVMIGTSFSVKKLFSENK